MANPQGKVFDVFEKTGIISDPKDPMRSLPCSEGVVDPTACACHIGRAQEMHGFREMDSSFLHANKDQTGCSCSEKMNRT